MTAHHLRGILKYVSQDPTRDLKASAHNDGHPCVEVTPLEHPLPIPISTPYALFFPVLQNVPPYTLYL